MAAATAAEGGVPALAPETAALGGGPEAGGLVKTKLLIPPVLQNKYILSIYLNT